MTDPTPYDRRSPMEHDRDDATSLRKLIDAVEKGTATAPQMWDTLGRNSLHAIAAFNGSLDAAKALHESLLPEWEWRLRENRAFVWRTPSDMADSGEVEDDAFRGLPARAWLLATLRAYEAHQ